MATNTLPTNDEWKRLLSAALRYQDAAPWTVLFDTDLFGVRNPETGETGYCCIFGAAGEMFGMNLYLGGEGVRSYRDMVLVSDHESQIMMSLAALSQKCVALSFEDRNELGPLDWQCIRSAGIHVRGAGNWPLFRRYDPGREPWPISGAQARFLAVALEQAVGVTERFRADPEVLNGPLEQDRVLVRVATPVPGGLQWRDEVEEFENAAVEPVSCSHHLLDELVKLPAAAGLSLEVAQTFLPAMVKPTGHERGFYPRLLMLVDGTSGLVLGHSVLEQKDFPMRLFEKIVAMLTPLGHRPASLRTCDPFLHAVLRTLLADAGSRIDAVQALPHSEAVFASMSGGFRGM